MPLFSLTPTQNAAGQIALAAVLAVAGFALLLPNPKGRRVKEGIAALIAAVAVFAAWVYSAYGRPMPEFVGSVLFCLFSAGALGFGTVLVVQKNPARGAIAFAFVILSTCGLFLLLAAPFLVAATIIIYAGAIIVTFLFVLMLSQQAGPSGENDRSREPWLGALAGFAFTGLVLFTLHLTQTGGKPAEAQASETPKAQQRLPVVVLTEEERQTLTEAVPRLEQAEALLSGPNTADTRKQLNAVFAPDPEGVHWQISTVVGPIRDRAEIPEARPGGISVPITTDRQALAVLNRVKLIRESNDRLDSDIVNYLVGDKAKKDRATLQSDVHKLRDEVVLLAGAGQLPARNVGNLGYLLYTDHLLAVELAGTLLLVATIGAIAIAQRKREPA
jgi:NADH-quinone oxidoreductase subunit J